MLWQLRAHPVADVHRDLYSVIPIVQLCLSLDMSTGPYKGPKAVVITTTVDQANQAYKRTRSFSRSCRGIMLTAFATTVIRDLGAALGIRATLAVGAAGGDFSNDVRTITQNSAQVVVGTPARVHDIFAGAGGVASVPSGEVRLLIVSMRPANAEFILSETNFFRSWTRSISLL
jgi:translation initiation factor 4A